MDIYVLLMILLSAVISCKARPDGAPLSTCQSLMPVHSGIRPQHGNSPYTVSAVKMRNNKVRVTISSPVEGEVFEGFVMQARSSSDRNKFVPGEFTTSEVSKAINCFGKKQSTLSHVDPNPKREVVTEWTPSAGVNEDVVFVATVAKSFAVFWTHINSQVLQVRSDLMPSTGRRGDAHSIYDDCFNSKGCFGLTAGCTEQNDCEVLFTYSEAPSGGMIFTLHGFLDESVYMAMGISQDAFMGNDSVTECFRVGPNVMARNSWNVGKSNTLTVEAPRDRFSYTFANGLTSCSWTTQYVTEANGQRYDFQNNKYFILLAKGPVSNGRLNYHSDRIATREAINFTVFRAIESEGVTDAVKVHGSLMVTAWVFFVSVAILLARHFKNAFENSTLGGVKIWFALHRAFMVTALCCMIIAFILIFVHINGWTQVTNNPHAILGCIATALALFNPIMAAFRPGPDHPKRPIFNWFHWSVGNAAHLFAVITIFYARLLPSSGLKDNFYVVMAIFVVVHLIVHLLYQIHAWTEGKKKTNEMSMNEMNGARGNSAQNGQSQTKSNVPANVFRILLLGIYCIFLLVILITLYTLIGVA